MTAAGVSQPAVPAQLSLKQWAVMITVSLGATLGGWLTDGLGWRWIFFINLPFGLLTVLLGLAFLAPDPPNPNSRRLQVDWLGIVLLAVGLGSLQAVLELGNQYLWFEDANIRGLALLSAVSLPVFIWWELRCRQSAVALRVLRHRSLVGGSLFAMVLDMGLYGTGGAPNGDQAAAAGTAEPVAGPGARKGRGPRPGRRSGPATTQ